IESELNNLHEKRSQLEVTIQQLKDSINSVNETKKTANAELALIDSETSHVLKQQSQAATNKLKVDERIKNIKNSLHDAKLSLSKTDQERGDVTNKIQQNSTTVKSLLEQKEKLLNLEQKLKIIRVGQEATKKELKSR